MKPWHEPPTRHWGQHWAQTTCPCGAGLIQLLCPAQGSLQRQPGGPKALAHHRCPGEGGGSGASV